MCVYIKSSVCVTCFCLGVCHLEARHRCAAVFDVFTLAHLNRNALFCVLGCERTIVALATFLKAFLRALIPFMFTYCFWCYTHHHYNYSVR